MKRILRKHIFIKEGVNTLGEKTGRIDLNTKRLSSAVGKYVKIIVMELTAEERKSLDPKEKHKLYK